MRRAAATAVSHPQIVEYRNLLVAEPSQGALERTIALVASIAGVSITVPGERSGRKYGQSVRQVRFDQDVTEFLERELPRRSRERFARPRGLGRLALHAAVALAVVPEFLENDGDVSRGRRSLAVDAGLVVFHQAYFALLHRLERVADLRAMVLEAANRFSTFVPVADQCRIRALTCDALGQSSLAEDYYEQAVEATPPRAHELMTVLQAAWAFMVEHERFAQAMRLLLRNADRVAERDLRELRELAGLTLELRRAA